MTMQNQAFLLSTSCNQVLCSFIYFVIETTPRWIHRICLFGYNVYKWGSWGFLSLTQMNPVAVQVLIVPWCTDFHPAASLNTLLIAGLLPEMWWLTGHGRACLSALFRSLLHYFPFGITAFSPIFKIVSIVDESAISTYHSLPGNKRSFGNKSGLFRANPSKLCLRLFIFSPFILIWRSQTTVHMFTLQSAWEHKSMFCTI